MNKKFGFCLLLILAIVGIQTRAFSATTATAALSATVSPVSSITATVLSSPTSIALSGPFSESIASPCWTANSPSVVTLNISNNTPNKVYIYTVHKEEGYWSSAATGGNSVNLAALSTTGAGVTINGLINAAAVKVSNYYNATTALRAWADVWGAANPTTFVGVSTTEGDWQWINDRSYTVNGALLTKSMLVNDNVSNTSLPVYIRGAWNLGKVSGTYTANLRFEIASQ